MRRLYLRIYLGFLGMLLFALAVWSLVLWQGASAPRERAFLRGASALLQAALPPPGAPRSDLAAAVERLAAATESDLAVFDAARRELAAAGSPVPPPEPARGASHFLGRRRPPVLALRLDDGRWIVSRFERRDPRGAARLGGLAVLAGALAVGAYPVARGIARRLERLERRVEALGAGDLSARVEVEGRDEVARLASSFNRAAERIEALVRAQRTLLASASHELRSPLARLRVAAELVAQGGEAGLAEGMARDVARLDEGVEELLLASRLDLLDATAEHESVDLLALAAEEAARAGGEARGEAVAIRGDGRSLRHLLRSLLENAQRHAPASPPAVEVARRPDGGAVVRVLDRGAGVPEALRERIFEPFVRGPGGSEAGVGLGLALARQIARHHGGELRHVPREGGGSCFEAELPGRSGGRT
jgi:signal transduction histidine kinase